MTNYIKNLPRPVCIVGLAKSGLAAKMLLNVLGVKPDDIVTLDQVTGKADFSKFNELKSAIDPQSYIVSPGFPLNNNFLSQEMQLGKIITSELSLASSLITTEKSIAITGSLGKSTTTALIGAACTEVDPDCFIGGNFGTPLAQYFIDLLSGKRKKASWLILELSSYQLENLCNISFSSSVLTYLSPNHLERYESLDHYYLTKLKLLRLTQENFLVNGFGGEATNFVQNYVKKVDQQMSSKKVKIINKSMYPDFRWGHVSLIGKYNQDNIALAIAISRLHGWGTAAEEAVSKFPGLPHRLENLGLHLGVCYINDSKSTTIESVLSAAESSLSILNHNSQKLYLLLGGRDKNLPWKNLSPLSRVPSLHCVFFGESGRKIKDTLSAMNPNICGPIFKSLSDAFQYSKKAAKAGDVVLLSPGGTSLDEFSSFEERGEFFKKSVAGF